MSRRKKRVGIKSPKKSEAADSRGLVAVWDRYWFGPVAAVRPYLLVKAVLLLLAFDVWMLRIRGGWSYSVDGFNVAHFQWLDALQPMPTAGLYVGVQIAVGLLALVCVLSQAGLGVRILLALLYTYSWAMTMRDGYQHHYFLSLALIAFVFFPPLRAGDLYAGGRTGRLEEEDRVPAVGRGTVSSWAYVLLGVNVAIVYLFTAVNKMEPGWRAGAIIERLAKGKQMLAPVEGWSAAIGMPGELFWQSMTASVVAVEMFIAAGYLLAAGQDGERRRWQPVVFGSAIAAVIGFNGIGNELVLDLQIGWFSYYMILFGCIYFLPPSFLFAAGKFLTFPSRKAASLRAAFAAALRRAPKCSAALPAAGSLAVIIFVGAAGVAVDLPGAAHVGFLTALVLFGILVFALAGRGYNGALRYIPAAGLAFALLWTTMAWSTIRFSFYDSYAAHLRWRHRAEAADEVSKKAVRYLPPAKKESPKP